MNVISVAGCSVPVYVGCIDNIFYVGGAEVCFQNIETRRSRRVPGLICPRSPPLPPREVEAGRLWKEKLPHALLSSSALLGLERAEEGLFRGTSRSWCLHRAW